MLKNILVTGGFGTIGLPLVNRLISEKHYVFVIDNFSNEKSLERFNEMNFRAKTTYTSLEFFNQIWADVKFESIIHLAGYSNIDSVNTNYEQAFNDIVLNTMHVINRCITTGSKLIYLEWPATDNDLYNFLHVEAVRLVQLFQESNKINAIIIPVRTEYTHSDICDKIIFQI